MHYKNMKKCLHIVNSVACGRHLVPAYKLRPIPIASDATKTLYLESGSLNNLACSTRVTEQREVHIEQVLLGALVVAPGY